MQDLRNKETINDLNIKFGFSAEYWRTILSRGEFAKYRIGTDAMQNCEGAWEKFKEIMLIKSKSWSNVVIGKFSPEKKKLLFFIGYYGGKNGI